MTTEEKAKDLAFCQGYTNNIAISKLIFQKCMDMAEWKDEQIRQYLNDCIDKAIAVNSPNMVKLFNKMKNDLNL